MLEVDLGSVLESENVQKEIAMVHVYGKSSLKWKLVSSES